MKYRYLVLISFIFIGQPFWAALKPYESHYVLLQDGDEVGKASRILTKTSDDHWAMKTRSRARLFFVKIVFDQSAEFTYSDGIITPLNFWQLSDTGLSSKREMKQTFDWISGKDTGKYKKKPWSRDLNHGSYSRVTDVLQFQEQLKLTNEPIPKASFEINYRGKAKTESYQFEGKEDITTPSGVYVTLKYKKLHSNKERVSYYWFAPELDYIPVRIQQIKDGSEQANMLLKSIDFK